MTFALTFIYTVADIILSNLFMHVYAVMVVAVAVFALFTYVKILGERW